MRLTTAIVLAMLAAPAAAAELPEFRPGLWEFKRSVDGGDGKPASLTNQKCTSPTEDMKKKTESMAQAGCQPSPVTKSGNLYTFSLNCTIQGIEVRSQTLIKVENDSAYVVDAESIQDGNTTREHLVATRIGECPAQ
jgi:hypothetical protein